MRIFLLFFMIFSLCFGNFAFEKELKFNANILGIKHENSELLIYFDNAEILKFNLFTDEISHLKKFEKIKTYFGDLNDPKIFSVDSLNGEILTLLEADFGERKLNFKNQNFKVNQGVKKAFFINENEAILLSLGGEIEILNLQNGEILRSQKISTSSISDSEISKNRQILAIATEGGKLYFYDILTQKIVREIETNKDNIHDISLNENLKIITGGNDKMAVFYDFQNAQMHNFQSEFLIYCTGISNEILAFTNDEFGGVSFINLSDFNKIAEIKTEQGILHTIIITENLAITASFDKILKFWRIK